MPWQMKMGPLKIEVEPPFYPSINPIEPARVGDEVASPLLSHLVALNFEAGVPDAWN